MQIPVQSNYWEIHHPLPGNPLATIANPLAVIGKLPTIGKLTIKDFQVGADGYIPQKKQRQLCPIGRDKS